MVAIGKKSIELVAFFHFAPEDCGICRGLSVAETHEASSSCTNAAFRQVIFIAFFYLIVVSKEQGHQLERMTLFHAVGTVVIVFSLSRAWLEQSPFHR